MFEVQESGETTRILGFVRVLLALAGIGIAVVLCIAFWLTPSEAGLGTHQQLGLPPCQFRILWRIRCPSCGMTTAWAHATKGNIVAALRTSVAGTVLALLAIVHVPWAFVSAWRGAWLWRPANEFWVLGAGAAFASITLVEWAIRVWQNG